MSTRSQVIIKDIDGEQWFYRHYDGYISGNMPQLFKFMKWLHEGKIRNNVEQSAGWLILIGAEEYNDYYVGDGKRKNKKTLTEPNSADGSMGWKCGAYEICVCRTKHGDIEWFYTIDLDSNTITIQEIYSGKEFTFTYAKLCKIKDWDNFQKKYWGD